MYAKFQTLAYQKRTITTKSTTRILACRCVAQSIGECFFFLLHSALNYSLAACVGVCRMAPEVVKNEPYSAKVDIWSLGCTVIEMFTGQRPWLTLNQIAALYSVSEVRKTRFT